MWSLTAASAAASVVFVSPKTITQGGRRSSISRSSAASISAVMAPWVLAVIERRTSGFGSESSSKKTSLMLMS